MTNFNKNPFVKVDDEPNIYLGWEKIFNKIQNDLDKLERNKKILVIECYPGVDHLEIIEGIKKYFKFQTLTIADSLMHSSEYIKRMVYPDVTDDRIFGYMTRLNIDSFYDMQKVDKYLFDLNEAIEGLHIIIGIGAAFIFPDPDLLVYADLSRWEIQTRMREHKVSNIGVDNRDEKDWMLLYKQGFFVDWRVCDRLKKKIMKKWDYLLDTNKENSPKMVSAITINRGLEICMTRPFSVVPFFDPGPWGGQWMKEKCNLDPNEDNYAWCFNCVPEENSLQFQIENEILEIPAINLLFHNAEKILGPAVHARFGDEFPIRFDFLDTMDGGNLSLQVHPLTEYIQEKFGMHYTQDESYYLMDAEPGAIVYLGLKENINPNEMINDLEIAQNGEIPFPADNYVQTWPAKKHDHFLIPAGTVHCSGKNSMVLEISATPYIFTFKLWDWGRLGLDGKPRPINIMHGKNVINWNRTTSWTKDNLVNKIEIINSGDGWVEEKTGLHEREFIETRRHIFTKPVKHSNHGGVNVICLVEGDEIIIESSSNKFEPFIVHYAEVFIVPYGAGEYIIKPGENSNNKDHITMKAFIRKNP